MSESNLDCTHLTLIQSPHAPSIPPSSCTYWSSCFTSISFFVPLSNPSFPPRPPSVLLPLPPLFHSLSLSLHPPATAQKQNINYRLTYMSRNVAKAGTHTHTRTHRYEALVNRWRCGKGMFALFACPSLLTLWAQGTLKCSTVNRSSNIILKLLKSRFQTSVRQQTRRVCVKSCLV